MAVLGIIFGVVFLVQPAVSILCARAYADVILAMDSSASIGYPNYINQLRFAANISNSFVIGPSDVRIGALIFSTTVEKLFDLGHFNNIPSIEQALLAASYMAGSTNTAGALTYILNTGMFSTTNGGRADAPHVVIVMTDGQSNIPDQTKTASQRLKDLGYHVISIGIGSDVDASELATLASDTSYTFTVASYGELYKIVGTVVQSLCRIGGRSTDYSNFCRDMMLTNGIYAHPGDCHKFIQCTFLGTSISSCPVGLAFDDILKTCYFDNHGSLCITTA